MVLCSLISLLSRYKLWNWVGSIIIRIEIDLRIVVVVEHQQGAESRSPDQEDHALWWRHAGGSGHGSRGDASKGQPARGQLELDATLVSSGAILLLDYKMFLVQVHPLKEERSTRRSIWCQSLKSGKSSSIEMTRFTWPTGHWRISPEYSIDNDWTFSSGIECHNRIV